MPTPSKFTAENRQLLLDAIKLGAPRKTAAGNARVSEGTFRRWMEEGRDAPAGTAKRKFHDDVIEAETHAPLRALAVVYSEMESNSALAWKFLERRMPGFAPPMPVPQAVVPQALQVHLSFHDNGALNPSTVEAFIEGEAVEQDESAEEVRALPASGSTA